MNQSALDNLHRIGQLKVGPRNPAEVRRLLAMAPARLADARLAGATAEGRFLSTYNAAHAAALAALRFQVFPIFAANAANASGEAACGK